MKPLNEIFDRILRDDNLICLTMENDALSYPIPGKIGGLIVERFFLYPNHSQPLKTRPYAWLSVDAQCGDILQYARCEADDFAASLQVPLETELDYSAAVEASFRKILSKRQEYDKVYQTIREFAFHDSLTAEQIASLTRYILLQSELFREPLLRFYRALSPEFYEWVAKLKNFNAQGGNVV